VLGNTCKPILLLTGIADQNLRCESRALLGELLHRYAGPMHTLRVHLPPYYDLVHGARNGFAHLEPAMNNRQRKRANLPRSCDSFPSSATHPIASRKREPTCAAIVNFGAFEGSGHA
jgi:hypothetical protein